MSFSKYEAAAYYDVNCHRISEETRYLVFDLDTCSFGICVYSEKTGMKLTDSSSVSGEEIDTQEQVRQLLGLTRQLSPQEQDRRIEEINGVLRNYLMSERMADGLLSQTEESAVSCSALEEAVREGRERLSAMTEEAQGKLSFEELSSARIILLGFLQEIYLFEYYIREALCADPFLPDERFINESFPIHHSEIVSRGMEYEQSRLKTDYVLLLWDGDNRETRRMVLAKKGQTRKELENPSYTGPVYVSEADRSLTIEANGEEQRISLPYAVEAPEGDLVDVAVGAEGPEVFLLIRRSRFPDRIYRQVIE